MPLYETVCIVRQDISSHEVDKIMDGFINIIQENEGKLVKLEYWGIRSLEYEINNNRKGHYVMIAFDAPFKALQEMERKMKYSTNLLRFMSFNVESISKDPSPILKSKSSNNEDIIDVTVTKDIIQE